jgi:fumarate reductase (CoM/CoB) subunit A
MKLGVVTGVSSDVLIIGAGGAGLRAAIEARREGAEVIVVSKSRAGLGNCTAISKAGLAVACGQGTADTSAIHCQDTVIGGRFLNDQHIVETVVQGGPQQVADLQSFGVELNKEGDKLTLLTVPGHSYARQVTCRRGLGISITVPMKDFAEKSGVKFLENILITRLLIEDGKVVGAVGIDKVGHIYAFLAKITILTCGGLGQLYLNTNNTADTTGDGYAIAYEAGASLADMEFVQFYPTALGQRGAKLVLYEILVYREGGVIRNSSGEDVLEKHGLVNGANMTRDRVSRACMQEILEGRSIEGKLILDLSRIKPERLDSLQNFLPGNILSRETKFLVSPTTHYAMGGIRINTDCVTDLPGLLAAGEVTAGMHGANRLGGNAITEILVMGTKAGKKAAESARKMTVKPDSKLPVTAEVNRLAGLGLTAATKTVEELTEVLKKAMWYNAGIIRTKEGIESALAVIDSLEEAYSTVSVSNPRQLWDAVELGNILTVARMICRAALERKESRGSHYRQDHPEENNAEWLKNIVISRKQNRMVLTKHKVEMVKVTP